jgi:hypothetical protein
MFELPNCLCLNILAVCVFFLIYGSRNPSLYNHRFVFNSDIDKNDFLNCYSSELKKIIVVGINNLYSEDGFYFLLSCA